MNKIDSIMIWNGDPKTVGIQRGTTIIDYYITGERQQLIQKILLHMRIKCEYDLGTNSYFYFLGDH